MDHDVLLADGGEGIAVVFHDPLGIARAVTVELEVGPILVDDPREASDAEHALRLEDIGPGGSELVAQHRFRDRVAVLVDLQLDDLASPPSLDCAAEGADQILRFVLDLDIAVAQYAERAVAGYLEAGKEKVGKPRDEALDTDMDRLLARHAHETRQRGRDQDHLDELLAAPGNRKQQP